MVRGDGTWGGLTSQGEIYWTRVVVVLLAVFLGAFGIFYIDKLPGTAFKFMYITGTIYFAGTVGTVTLGLYWRKANRTGAYLALVLGALAPVSFLLMNLVNDLFPGVLPGFLESFVANSNLAAFISLLLGGSGMVVGSLLTQESDPPRQLDFSGMK